MHRARALVRRKLAAMYSQRLSDDFLNLHARIEACERILEDDLQVAAQPLPRMEYDPDEREGVSTVNLNHPLAVNPGKQENYA